MLETAEAATNHISIQMENSTVNFDEQVLFQGSPKSSSWNLALYSWAKILFHSCGKFLFHALYVDNLWITLLSTLHAMVMFCSKIFDTLYVGSGVYLMGKYLHK